MTTNQRRVTAVGFLGTLVILSGILYLVGIEDLLRVLSRADTGLVVLVGAVTVGWLTAWALGLRTVLAVLGVRLSVVRSFLVLNGAIFSNNVTPFGQAGGEPVAALLISKVAETEYERGLAAIASVDTINFLPSITLALIGAAYFATEITFSQRLRVATGLVVGLAAVVPALIYLGWRNRDAVEQRLESVLTPLVQRLTKVLPGISPPDDSDVKSRIEGFFVAIERIATNRRGIVLTLTASTLGWVLQMIALWAAFWAIGTSIPFSVMLFVVPMGALASITPLPGGTGGIETVLVAILASLPSIAIGLETALAAVVIFRGFVYWIPILIGGFVVSWVGVDAFGTTAS
ncbi:lysylphosphatidylglycerol synthase transmembrane domain-containing protein [Haladaptatus halobius]|uniref:lysylphosphatidylglycerol synthase transmembrane domain-containing protein n=1 Tax=Haladaptatus halobius TaxID=2884875 RepID=UPI001D09EBD3|nr:flippase-like domain-containing protein [Haladaptatus halobius]